MQEREPDPKAQRARILVVQGDACARSVLVELLQGRGYAVATAPDATQALQQLQSERFDLVLNDVATPHGDTLELVVQLRDRGLGDVPMILVSHQHDSGRGISGLNSGADDLLFKPIDPEELLARVRAQLRRSARHLQLARDSVLDPLTRVLNRRGLAELHASHAALQRRRGGLLSVFVLDLDGFKVINDCHGHAAGDAVLSHLGRTLAGAVRASDRVARLGGDEFAILMPQADRQVARVLACRIRALSPLSVPVSPPLTIKIGFSLGSATGAAHESLTQLLARADASMYRAKRARVSIGDRCIGSIAQQ